MFWLGTLIQIWLILIPDCFCVNPNGLVMKDLMDKCAKKMANDEVNETKILAKAIPANSVKGMIFKKKLNS